MFSGLLGQTRKIAFYFGYSYAVKIRNCLLQAKGQELTIKNIMSAVLWVIIAVVVIVIVALIVLKAKKKGGGKAVMPSESAPSQPSQQQGGGGGPQV